jgi:hypothetical protein
MGVLFLFFAACSSAPKQEPPPAPPPVRAAPPAPAPERLSEPMPARELPKTASALPAVGLAGVLGLAGAGALHVLRGRIR